MTPVSYVRKPRKLRKYEAAWHQLRNKRRLNLSPVLGEDEVWTEEKVKSWIKTVRKAISKEKYADDNYRMLHPNAEIEIYSVNYIIPEIVFLLTTDLTISDLTMKK